MELPTTIRPRWSQLASFIGFGLLFLTLLVVSIAIPWLDPKTFHTGQGVWLMLFSIPLWGSMSAIAVWSMVTLTAVYNVDSRGIVRRGTGSERRFEWAKIVDYEQSGSGREGYRLTFEGGGKLDLPFRYLDRGGELKVWLDETILKRFRQAPPLESTIESEAANKPFLIGLSAFLVLVFGGAAVLVGGDRRPDSGATTGICIGVCCLVLPLLLYPVSVRTILYPDRLVRRGLLGAREMLLADVRVLKLSSQYHDGNGTEFLTLQTADGKMFLSSSAQSRYTRLRDALLRRCPQAQVVDVRPVGDRTSSGAP